MRQHKVSFKCAFNGILIAIKTQLNMKLHFVALILVTLTALYFQVSYLEILVLFLTVAMVLMAELFNTALEFLADAVTLETNQLIGKAKDVSAGAVLMASIFAFIIGLVIFLPKFTHLL